jgi:polar amino acid transport system substrate-binding protein
MDVEQLRSILAPTGELRVVINLGNPVLAQGTPEAPRGVTVDLAESLGGWLSTPVRLLVVDAARASWAALAEGRADVCFLAVEPEREADVAFTAPYVVIEGVYVTDADARFATSDDVDRDGVRVGVRRGSAYELHLSRTLRAAEAVKADEAVDVYEQEGLEVCAGVRLPMEEYATRTGRRILEPAFMQIRQAVGVPRGVDPAALAELAAHVEHLKATGFVEEALARSGVSAHVAPPAP